MFMLLGFVTLVSIWTSTVALGTGRPKFDWDRIHYVYAFGDSYTFVQGKDIKSRICSRVNYYTGSLGHPNFRCASSVNSNTFER